MSTKPRTPYKVKYSSGDKAVEISNNRGVVVWVDCDDIDMNAPDPWEVADAIAEMLNSKTFRTNRVAHKARILEEEKALRELLAQHKGEILVRRYYVTSNGVEKQVDEQTYRAHDYWYTKLHNLTTRTETVWIKKGTRHVWDVVLNAN